MRLSFRLKHHFFNAFRELFVHHHGSLEFRAKVFALFIAANDKSTDKCYEVIKEIGLDIYKDDEQRADLLMMTTKEKVNKVKDENGLDIDTLIANIQQDLKIIPRYAKKIEPEQLKKLISLSNDRDTISYLENILEFLENLKEETLKAKKNQIESDEKILEEKAI